MSTTSPNSDVLRNVGRSAMACALKDTLSSRLGEDLAGQKAWFWIGTGMGRDRISRTAHRRILLHPASQDPTAADSSASRSVFVAGLDPHAP
jgi:hypothetical protein